MTDDLLRLPNGLPEPQDDGACAHLPGMEVARIGLQSTSGASIDLSSVGPAVVYCYPRTGGPMWAPPPEWDGIPGARGCTPESTGFRDHHRELADLGYRVYGLSTQAPAEQAEARDRLALPFDLLSDEARDFATAMRLPTFEVAGTTLIKRLTMTIDDGKVARVFCPVFPPNTHAAAVVATLT